MSIEDLSETLDGQLMKRMFPKRNLEDIYILCMRILKKSIKESYRLGNLDEAIFLTRTKCPVVLPSTMKLKKMEQRGKNWIGK